jgi:prepilin-type N-terminal cleavage/methylation domain-containing protein
MRHASRHVSPNAFIAQCPSGRGFTLIELLLVVAIVAILAAVAIPNLLLAHERVLRASDASNLHAIGIAMQAYFVDHGNLPAADAEAGPCNSMGAATIMNAPAAGGSWDGVPWILFDQHYISDWKQLFCPKYLTIYANGTTIRGGWPRYHNFRYAYNTASIAQGGHDTSDILNGTTWLARDLYLQASWGWYASSAPNYPADYLFPWKDGTVELALYGDLSVRPVMGGTDTPETN